MESSLTSRDIDGRCNWWHMGIFLNWREEGTDQVRSALCRLLFCKLNESIKI